MLGREWCDEEDTRFSMVTDLHIQYDVFCDVTSRFAIGQQDESWFGEPEGRDIFRTDESLVYKASC